MLIYTDDSKQFSICFYKFVFKISAHLYKVKSTDKRERLKHREKGNHGEKKICSTKRFACFLTLFMETNDGTRI